MSSKFDLLDKHLKIFSIDPIRSFLSHAKRKVISISIHQDRVSDYEDILLKCESFSIPYHIINDEEYSKWRFKTSGIMALFYGNSLQFDSLKEYFQLFSKSEGQNYVFLILDCIQGAGNFGAIFRTCNHMNIDAIITPKDRSVNLLSKEAFKGSSGVLHYVPHIVVPNLVQVIKSLKKMDFWIYGLDINGERDLWDCKFERNIALISGNESSGMRELTKKNCDFLISIKNTGIVDSLNVSVASAIALSEIQRQLQKSN